MPTPTCHATDRRLPRCAVALLVMAAGLWGGAAEVRGASPYVALGDSFTAGPLIPNQTGKPEGCARSDRNYPALVAESIRPSGFRDVSCSSARTTHMTQPQRVPNEDSPQQNPPQFAALAPDIRLVTVGIGGNDIGFSDIAITCGQLGLFSRGGSPCRDRYTAGGRDEIAERIAAAAPKLAATIAGIQQRSPRARLLLVGYPVILPDSGPGCWPTMPVASGDMDYLRSVEKRLNAMVAEQSAAGGAEFVDTYDSSIGHDVCQPPGIKWVEGPFPTSPAFPVHPNALGMENSARQVLATLSRPVPNDFAIVRRRARRGGAIALRLRAPARGFFEVRARSTRGTGRPARRRRTPFAYGRTAGLARRAGTVRLVLRPGRTARRLLRRTRRLRVSLAVSFEPAGGATTTKRIRLRVRAAAKRRSRR